MYKRKERKYKEDAQPFSIRLPIGMVEKLKTEARKIAADKDVDYSYTDLIRDIIKQHEQANHH
jgi:hypothetical protein